MITGIIFDLDGVIVDTENLHYECLTEALSIYDLKIDKQEYENLSGVGTLKRLKKLLPNINETTLQEIYTLKGRLTIEKSKNLHLNDGAVEIIKYAKSTGLKLALASNARKDFVDFILRHFNIDKHFQFVISADSITTSKPNPEIFQIAMSQIGLKPEETIIIEDSLAGLQAAFSSGANVLSVSPNKPLSLDRFLQAANFQFKPIILIPMAGMGSRFLDAGYEKPKPLIDVGGMSMIEKVISCVDSNADYVFIYQKQHNKNNQMVETIKNLKPGSKVIELDGLTDGAARTVLTAQDIIDERRPLIVVNSDNFIEWDFNRFLAHALHHELDGSIAIFASDRNPKWSFAKVNEDGLVLEVAEKNPISEYATAGVYYWDKAKYFFEGANAMIEKDIRVNNEYYVCPVYNENIESNQKIGCYFIDKMWGLGTPEDLQLFLESQ